MNSKGILQKKKYIYIYIYFFFFLATPHSLWDTSSPTSDRTWDLSSESTES